MFRNYLVAVVSVLVASCGGSGGGSTSNSVADTPVVTESGNPLVSDDGTFLPQGDCPALEGTGQPGSLVGIYDITNYQTDPVNVVYTVIGPDGGTTDFDFDNDSVGDGQLCFVKGQEGLASITHVSGDRYLWTFVNPFDNGCPFAVDEVQISRSDESLTINGSVTWRAATGTSVADLVECPQ